MKVVATADLHGAFLEIEECDLLLIGGDVCPVEGDHGVPRQRAWLRGDFADWLIDVPAKWVVWIAGNHDFVCESPGFRRVADEIADGVGNAGGPPVTYLQDEAVTLGGVKIYGSPWVSNLRNWAFFAPESKWEHLAGSMPPCDIALLHSPIPGVLDGGHPEWCSMFMAQALRRAEPKVVVCGHIHEGYGQDKKGEIKFYNAAHMNWFYEPVNPPFVFEI